MTVVVVSLEPVPRHVRRRSRARLLRLRTLGFADYASYLRSPAWAAVKACYRASDLPQECMCGATDVQLHHTTYERVGGEELLDDLRPLCPHCHQLVHVLERRGDIELDFKGLYDAKRAERNANETLRIAQERADERFGYLLQLGRRVEAFATLLLAHGLSRRNKYHARRARHFARSLARGSERQALVFRYRYLSERLALIEDDAEDSPIAREIEAIKRQLERAEAKCVQAGGARLADPEDVAA